MDIKVLGSGCAECDEMYAHVCAAVEKLNIDTTVQKIEDLVTMVSLGVMQSPALMVDGNISAGHAISVKEATKLLRSVQ
ncbi:MAG: thioredoxin family protein [Atopobiaceae bacterium]|jgi:small redox-active disulfide protein 2